MPHTLQDAGPGGLIGQPVAGHAGSLDAAASRPTLLIVDDEPGPRESLRIVFKDSYKCVVAGCGREGVDLARRHNPDVAILDVKMPDLSGIEVLRELKQMDADVECIMLTGYETMETARAAIRFGAADFLNKPFDVFAIRERVEACRERRMQKRALGDSMALLKQTNAELASALAQRDRAATASVLSAGVIHDMNDPLTLIGWYTAMLDRDVEALKETAPKAAEAIQQRQAGILQEIERCKAIARRFLNFARQTGRGDEVTEAEKLLEDAAALLKSNPACRSMTIASAVTDHGLKIKGHPVELLQMLINLGVNAIQAMQGTGALRLVVERASVPPARPAFRSDSFDPRLPLAKLSVTDTGPGIPPDVLKKLFTPYFTTKEGGTGLGLAIVSQLIRRYSGAIEVISEAGKGATFCVYLPIVT